MSAIISFAAAREARSVHRPLAIAFGPRGWAPPTELRQRIRVVGGPSPEDIGKTGMVTGWLLNSARLMVRLDGDGSRSLAITEVTAIDPPAGPSAA